MHGALSEAGDVRKVAGELSALTGFGVAAQNLNAQAGIRRSPIWDWGTGKGRRRS